MSNAKDLDQLLDERLDAMQREHMDDAAEQAAYDRVWEATRQAMAETADAAEVARKQAEAADVPSIRGAHDEAKAWLYQDSLTETASRGRAVSERESKPQTSSGPSINWSTWGWRLAAAAAVIVMVVGVSFQSDLLTIKTGGLIHIENLAGEAFIKDAQGNTRRVQTGDDLQLGPNDRLLTGKDGQLMLATQDGSVVEVAPRTELTVWNRRPFWRGKSDHVVDIDRGNVIVEASEQGSGHLYVDTPDAFVTVTGTVFSVNTGMKGSRVSVIEGSVEVEQGSGEETLAPGDQVTTTDNLSNVPITEEISWSQKFEQHISLLKEAAALGDELDRVIVNDLRTSTELLENVPTDAMLYFGMPNVARMASDAYGVLEDKLATSDVLADWWEQEVARDGLDRDISAMMAEVGGLGDELGEEIAIALLRQDGAGDDADFGVLIMAEVDSTSGLQKAIGRIAEQARDENDTDPIDMGIWLEGIAPDMTVMLARGEDDDTMIWWNREGMLFASPQDWVIRAVATDQAVPRDRLADGTLLGRLAAQYEEGTEWVFGIDLTTITDGVTEQDDIAEQLGLYDAEFLIGEQKQRNGYTEGRITLDFDQPRRGIPAWLDTPGAIGAMQYISSDAVVAGAFAMETPSVVIDELIHLFGNETVIDFDGDPNDSPLGDWADETGLSLMEFIEPMGGEFAFALEFPLIPTPNWKVIVETYDPQAMQDSIKTLVDEANAAASESDLDTDELLELTSSDSGGRTYWVLQNPMTTLAMHYTFDDGYLVAGSSRVQIDNAIKTAGSGLSLDKSAKFRNLLPQDRENNVSGVLYQDLGAALDTLSFLTNQLTKNEAFADTVDAVAKPSLTVAYGEEEAITFVYRREGGLFGGTIRSFFTLRTLMDLDKWRQDMGSNGGSNGGSNRKTADETLVAGLLGG